MTLQAFVAKSPSTPVTAAWLNKLDFSTQERLVIHAVDSGVKNAYVLTPPAAGLDAVLAIGTLLAFKPLVTNDAASTISAFGSGAAAVINEVGTALTGGEINSAGNNLIRWTGTQWQLVNPDITVDKARTPAEIAASVTPVNYSYPPGHVYRYATNTAPGTTDMTVAFQRASLVSLNPYAPNDTFKITGMISIRATQVWRLDNPIINITGNTIVFSAADQINDWRILGGYTVVGDNTTGGGIAGTGRALYVGGCNRYYAENVCARNIKGVGIYVDAGTFVDPLGDQGKFVACTADSCSVGFQTIPGNAGEYCTFINCDATRCNAGTNLSAGNTVWIGGNIEGNTDGVLLSNGANSAHGMFVGTNINHNTQYAIHVIGVTNGHSFVGCHVYAGSIWFESSTGVIFDDCFIDADAYYFDGSQGCGFVDCLMPLGATNTINNDFNAHPSFPIWRNCKTLQGKTFPTSGGVNANIEGVRVIATSPGIAITAANLLAVTTILFTDAANQAANQTAQTLYDGYVAATGLFTNTGHGLGFVKINAQIMLTHNAADSALGISCTLQINGVGIERYCYRTEITTTSICFSFDGFIAMNAGDTLRFNLGSNALLANAVTVAAANTRVLVEGL